MRLRDRIRAAVQTFRETPDVHSRLTAAEYELKIADQALELRKRECEDLRGTIEEKDSRLRFLKAKTAALSSALKDLSPMLSTTEEMKSFYNTVSRNLDPEGFTLYRVAERMAGVDLKCLFPDEEARGALRAANGHERMRYLTAYCFDAVTWEDLPGDREKAVLGEVDTSTPAYQRFERQLYENVLKRMGFDELLSPRQTEPAPEYVPAFTARSASTMLM